MQNSTPSTHAPKDITLKTLKAFARAYRPQAQTSVGFVSCAEQSDYRPVLLVR
ncbi:MAG: hypothetical protein II200_07000 [Bacteroidaceae bacterium]|nr:hypothetical protein [Bacteroidaceae bacterium]